MLSVLFSLNLLAAGLAHGEYPTTPIRFIVPFSPGGLVDVVGRLVPTSWPRRLGQRVIVDNRPGADGAIAAETALKAQPDGRTIFMSPTSAAPSLRKKSPYEAVTRFAPIASIGRRIDHPFPEGSGDIRG